MANLIASRYKLPAALLFISIFGAGCSSGSGDNLDASGQPITDNPVTDTDSVGGTPDSTPSTVSSAFGTIQSTVFTPSCAECHGSAGASAGLRLDEGSAFAAIVGVASTEVSTLSRIAPGDPDNSYLVQKIEGTAAVGGRMPLGGPPLPQETIDFIRQWVADGAIPDSSAALALAPRVMSASIEQDGIIDSMPSTITLVWTSPIDGISLNDETVSLQRSGGDGSFVEGNELAVGVSVADQNNPYVTTLVTSLVTKVDDTFQLRITGEGDNYARANDARAIDGDSDGVAGGTFTLDFSVE